MKLLLGIVELLSEKILEHYGQELKGIAISGIESLEESKPLIILLVLDKTHKISFYARQEIAEYFIKKIENDDVYFEYVKRYLQRPPLYFIVIDPKELSFHNPFILYVLQRGKILFDKYKILEEEKKKINAKSYGGVLQFGDINKGEVIEI